MIRATAIEKELEQVSEQYDKQPRFFCVRKFPKKKVFFDSMSVRKTFLLPKVPKIKNISRGNEWTEIVFKTFLFLQALV